MNTLSSSDRVTEEESEVEMMYRTFKSMPDRSSHMPFFHDGKRDWNSIKNFWSALISQNPINLHPSDEALMSTAMPPWVSGTTPYGVTDIQAIHECATEELLGYHARGDKKKGNKRKTFALRIGYDGSRYQGYQSQGVSHAGSILTVEDDVKQALGGMSSMSAGRTDKDVSAISQVVSCHTFDQSCTPASLRLSFQQSTAVRDGRLTLFDCNVVPKKFHALFSATWRRYLYLFPLHVRRPSNMTSFSVEQDEDRKEKGAEEVMRWYTLHGDAIASNGPSTDETSAATSGKVFEVDIDIDHVNKLLQSLEGKLLSFNGFAYKDLQKTNRGALAARGGGEVRGTVKSEKMGSGGDTDMSVEPASASASTSSKKTTVATTSTSKGPEAATEPSTQKRYTSVDAALDKCTLHKASAYVVNLTPYLPAANCGNGVSEGIGTEIATHAIGKCSDTENLPQLAVCVELVGSRFLRRMVRILVATVLRECQLPVEERDDEVLLKICQLGLRDRSSMAITGEGLAMAGVGYDLQSLAIPKFGTITTNPKKLKKKALKRALAIEEEEKERLKEEDEKKRKVEGVVVTVEGERSSNGDSHHDVHVPCGIETT